MELREWMRDGNGFSIIPLIFPFDNSNEIYAHDIGTLNVVSLVP